MRKSIFPHILAAAAAAAAGCGQAATAQERREIPAYRELGLESDVRERAELHAFLDAYRDAWGRQDAGRLMALHLADTEWINAYARMFQDRASLGDFLERRLFPAFDPAVSRTEAANMRLVSLRRLGGDAAVMHLYTEGRRGPSRNAGEAARRTHLHLVLLDTEEGWKVAHTAIMDARN